MPSTSTARRRGGHSPEFHSLGTDSPRLTLPAGSRLSVVVRETAAVASGSRTVYGGAGLTANFADAGVTLTTGSLQ
jgi:hypothetical protein